MTTFQLLPGLPIYGPPALPFPVSWGRLGREGTVVEFYSSAGGWAGNFAPGVEGLSLALPHPDGHHVVVASQGDVWIVDPDAQTAEQSAVAIDALWPVHDPEGYVLSRQGLALLRLGAAGILWHTRRLSWDGFADLNIGPRTAAGQAWNAVDDVWQSFEVDLATGRSTGGAYDSQDTEGWEKLANSHHAA